MIGWAKGPQVNRKSRVQSTRDSKADRYSRRGDVSPLYVETLAKECDRFEYALTGEDLE